MNIFNSEKLKRKTVALILNAVFSFIIAAAWPFHINEKGHSHHEGKCSICISVTAPQLNSDCGNNIISRPEGFISIFDFFSDVIKDKYSVSFFFSRAPPYFF